VTSGQTRVHSRWMRNFLGLSAKRRLAARVSVAVVCLATVAFAPAADARAKGRGSEQGKSATTGGASPPDAGTHGKDRRNDPPPVESPEERHQRQQRVLRGKDRDAIREVLAELHALETGDARALLVDFVKRSRNERLKGEALIALGWRGNRAALEFLRGKHGLSSARPPIVAAACRAVGKVGDPATKPLLLARVTSKHAVVAAAALGGLVALDRKSADLPGVIEIGVESSHPVVRAEAARALGLIKSSVWRSQLASLLGDPAPAVRIAACEALAVRKDEISVPLLMQVQTADPDAKVRSAAKKAMLTIDAALADD